MKLEKTILQSLRTKGLGYVFVFLRNRFLSSIDKCFFLIDNADLLWDSDDEKELEGLSLEERERKKRQIIERRKQGQPDLPK